MRLFPLLLVNVLLSIICLLTSNFYLIWIFIELRIFRFIIILVSDLQKLQIRVALKYFSFQALRSVLILSTYLLGEFTGLLMIILLILKLGIAPFHLWFISVTKQIKRLVFFWVSVVQKIVPLRLFIILDVYFTWSVLLILLTSTTLRSLNMVLQTKIIGILASSSVFSRNWIFFRLLKSPYYSWLFFGGYAALQIIILIKIYEEGISPRGLDNGLGGTIHHLLVLIIILFIAGFPPSPVFFIKLEVLIHLSELNFLVPIYLICISRVVNFCYLSLFIIKVIGERQSSVLVFDIIRLNIFSILLVLLRLVYIYIW